MPFDLVLPHVFHRTTRRSLFAFDVVDDEDDDDPTFARGSFLTIRSLMMIMFTLPTIGTRPHATGAVQSAA